MVTFKYDRENSLQTDNWWQTDNLGYISFLNVFFIFTWELYRVFLRLFNQVFWQLTNYSEENRSCFLIWFAWFGFCIILKVYYVWFKQLNDGLVPTNFLFICCLSGAFYWNHTVTCTRSSLEICPFWVTVALQHGGFVEVDVLTMYQSKNQNHVYCPGMLMNTRNRPCVYYKNNYSFKNRNS